MFRLLPIIIVKYNIPSTNQGYRKLSIIHIYRVYLSTKSIITRCHLNILKLPYKGITDNSKQFGPLSAYRININRMCGFFPKCSLYKFYLLLACTHILYYYYSLVSSHPIRILRSPKFVSNIYKKKFIEKRIKPYVNWKITAILIIDKMEASIRV